MTETKYPETLELSMLAVQSELTNPIKDATNPHFKSKYATLPEIRNLVTPILAKQGLYVTQFVHGELLKTFVTHAPSGRSLYADTNLMMDKATPQGQGSAITYARRYALCAMLNIAANEDDDGHAAEKPKPKSEPKIEQLAPERKAFILEIIEAANDEATVRKIFADAEIECKNANDPMTYNEITKAAKAKLAKVKETTIEPNV